MGAVFGCGDGYGEVAEVAEDELGAEIGVGHEFVLYPVDAYLYFGGREWEWEWEWECGNGVRERDELFLAQYGLIVMLIVIQY